MNALKSILCGWLISACLLVASAAPLPAQPAPPPQQPAPAVKPDAPPEGGSGPSLAYYVLAAIAVLIVMLVVCVPARRE